MGLHSPPPPINWPVACLRAVPCLALFFYLTRISDTTMFPLFRTLVVGASVALSAAVYGHSFQLGELHVTHPYARPTTAGIQNGAAWFGVKNAGAQDDRVVGVQSDVAEHAEIHDMAMENDVMRMFRVDGIRVPAGQSVKLGEGNKLHVMLLGLKQPLQVGDKFTLTIEFEHAGKLPVEVWVEQPKAKGQQGAGEAHHHHH